MNNIDRRRAYIKKMNAERDQKLLEQVKPLVNAGYTPDEIRNELDVSWHTAHRVIQLAKGFTSEQYLEYLMSLKH